MMIRLETNLTRLSDTELKNIVKVAFDMGMDREDFDFNVECFRGLRPRTAVIAAACAIDTITANLTKREVSSPSPESLAWSNLEGGHIFHVEPELEISMFLS